MRSEGYEVVEASDGAEALVAFDEGGADLVMLELALPGMSGFGVRVLESQPGSIKVSAHDPESAGAAFDLAGRRA